MSIARQDDSGLLHVVVADAVTMNATGVAIAQDDDGGRRLARFVARAVIRALDAVSWVPRPPDADAPSPEADHA